MSEPTVALDEVNPAPTEIVASAVAHLSMTIPDAPAVAPDDDNLPSPPLPVLALGAAPPEEPPFPPAALVTEEPVIDQAKPAPPVLLISPPLPPAPPPPPA